MMAMTLIAAAGLPFFRDPATYVLVSFILFIAFLVYLKVPAMVARMLDERAAGIAKNLDEARRLRDEAEKLLAEYKTKRSDAEAEAAGIIAAAKAEAKAYADEQAKRLKDALARRKAQAEQKIALAEAAAVKDVRAAAADLAMAAAAALLKDSASGKTGEKLVAESIAAVKSRLQ
jgi:F-type H+-transporting ATPase subunit b